MRNHKMEKKEGYNRFLNKKVAVFYADGENHISRKDGLIISVSDDSIILYYSELEILIPKIKIVRVEVKNE